MAASLTARVDALARRVEELANYVSVLNAEVLHIRRLLADGDPDRGHPGMAQDLAALREELRGLRQEVTNGNGNGKPGNGARRKNPMTLRVSLSLSGALSVSYALAVTQFRELLGDDPSHAIVLGVVVLGVVVLAAVVTLIAVANTE